jgi:hypothetical protein
MMVTSTLITASSMIGFDFNVAYAENVPLDSFLSKTREAGLFNKHGLIEILLMENDYLVA